MSLLKTIQQNQNSIRTSGIKTVRGAVIYEYHNIIYCRHYDTVIFAYDMIATKAEALKDLSQTSNRQIQILADAFSLKDEQITDVRESNGFTKWQFKAPRK